MSVVKNIAINFSDGTNTVYTKSASLYIPFEVESFTVMNQFIFASTSNVIATVLCPQLMDRGSSVLTMVRAYTTHSPITHIYNRPRPINGNYNFTVDLGSEFVVAPDITGLIYNQGSNVFVCTAGIPIIGQTLIGQDIRQPCTILEDLTGGLFLLSSYQSTTSAVPEVFHGTLPYFVNHNFPLCKITMEIEFNEKFKMFKNLSIQNTQYFTWRFSSTATSSQLIDVLFPVDEIEITQIEINSFVVPDVEIYGIYSDLIFSSDSASDLQNNCFTNPLTNFNENSTNYQTNRLSYKYPQPRMIRGMYKVWSSNTMTGVSAPLCPMVIQLRFIQYRR